MLHCTGSGVFNRYLQRAALSQNLQLSEKGLCKAMKLGQESVLKTGEYLPIRTEADIFAALDVVWKEPRERLGKMDIIRASTGRPFFETRDARAAAADESDDEVEDDVPALPAPRGGALPAPSGALLR